MSDTEKNSVDGESSPQQISTLKEKIAQLIEEKEISEKAFSQKRAVFKELFVQKENDLKESRASIKELRQQVVDITTELRDLRSATALSENGRKIEFDNLKRKYEEEIESLRHIMKQGMSEEVESIKQDMEEAKLKWETERKSLLAQIAELKQDDESVLSQVAGNLRKQIKKEFSSGPFSGFVPGGSPDGHSNTELEEEMQKAKQDADFLRTIVVPYEEEIQSLKKKIRVAYEQIDRLEGNSSTPQASVSIITQDCSNDIESAEEIANVLASERILAEQYRNRFQMCMDKLQSLKQFHTKHSDNLSTALSTNDKQELNSILELTDELDPALLKLDNSFSESPLHHRKIRTLLGLAESPSKNWSAGSLKKASSGDELNHVGPGYLRSGTNSVDTDRSRVESDTQSLLEYSTGRTTDEESFESVNKGRARSGARSYVISEGRRVVSEKEWSRMQLQLEAAQKQHSGGICEMCSNYEDQLQTLQAIHQETEKKLRNVQNQFTLSEETVASLRTDKDDLENQLKTSSFGQRDRIDQLTELLTNSEHSLKDFLNRLTTQRDAFYKELNDLRKERDRVKDDMTRLHQSYKSLLGKRQKRAVAMQQESILLPDNREGLELLALQLKEEIIATKSAAEQKEEELRSQIAFLKDQIRAEQAERASLEESMQRDIADLQEQVARLASCESEYEREKKVRETAEKQLAEADDKLGLLQALESENKDLKLRVQSLQMELENSESVQKDFVQLSQTLQIQLEQLRLDECEVRWQHDEDVSHCPGCRAVFGMSRKRYHCRHCGKVLCADCLGKTVLSGPNKRPSRVCQVCHTMLVKDAVPYFSQPNPSKS